jgi:hypothetical protein
MNIIEAMEKTDGLGDYRTVIATVGETLWVVLRRECAPFYMLYRFPTVERDDDEQPFEKTVLTSLDNMQALNLSWRV